MKNNYRQVIRLICIFVLFLAVGIVFVRKGVIPRFWERTEETVQPVGAEPEAPPDEMLGPEAEGEPEAPPGETVELGAAGEPDTTRGEGTEPGETVELGAAGEPDTTRGEGTEPGETVEMGAPGEPEAPPAAGAKPDAKGKPDELLAAYLANDPRTPTEAKGIFVTGPVAGTKGMMPKLVKLVEKTELNAMVIDIKNDAGEVTYKMGHPLAGKIGAEVRYVADMPALVQQLKEKGIYLIARIVAFKDPVLAEQKPKYAVKNADGSVFHDNNGMAWVNPYNEKVWDYLIDISLEAAELGFDEIQYDYIRFSTAEGISEADFGKKAKGKTRQEAVNGFLTKAYETLAPMGVYVSADVFGTIICNESDGELIGQDYVEMAKHCDYICPMVYPSHYVNNAYEIAVPDAKPYELIRAAVADGEEKLSAARGEDASVHIAKQRPWLQAFTATWVKGHISYRGKQLRDQVKGAGDAGVDEWLLWNAANNYDNVKSGLGKK